jgi:hypothetical protein
MLLLLFALGRTPSFSLILIPPPCVLDSDQPSASSSVCLPARFEGLGNLQTNNPLFFLSYIHCHYDEEPLSQFSRAFTTGGHRVLEKYKRQIPLLPCMAFSPIELTSRV